MEDNLKNILINFKKTWRFVKEDKKYIILFLIFSLILCGISVITPLLSAKMLLYLTDGLFKELITVTIIVLIVEITRNLFNYLYNILFNKYSFKATSRIQVSIAKEAMKLEISELDNNSSGVFIDRINNDTKEIVSIFSDLGDGLIDVISNIGILIAIYFINKIMFAYFLLMLLIIFILEHIRMKKYFELDKKRRKLSEKNTGLVSELIRGTRDIKSLNIENNFLKKAESKLIESNNEKYKMQKVNAKYNLITGSVKDISKLLLIVLGIYLCLNNQLTTANFVIIYMYKDRLLELLRYCSFLIELTKKFNVAATRVFEVIDDEKFKKEIFGNKVIDKINGDFEFRNVSFSYNEDKVVLKNISFKIHANETVAFVGKSGSGKSTIFSLLNRLYLIDSGEILIDNVNINDLTKDSIRNNMSIITQNPYIFNFSIRDNLKLVKDDMTDEEMIEACKLACLHDFIVSLKDGYDTIVGEGGITLSGGQRQRLAIARALLKKTEIILFDEATSALDNETQKEIQKAINNMKGEYTILIIAHRLSTVIDSERIIVIDDGKVIAEGTHNELFENNEFYRNLYEKELV